MNTSRRNFMRASVLGGLALTSGIVNPGWSAVLDGHRTDRKSKVAVMAGDDRTDNIFQGLKSFSTEIKKAIGNRRVVLKPNNVSTTTPLCATHAQALEGTLEFLKSIGIPSDQIVIAESAASGPSFEGFENYGYLSVAEKYHVKLMDLDREEYEKVHVFSEKDFQPHPARLSKVLLDRRNNFIISNAVMKTHDRVVATLSLKNIVFGAPIKDEGFRWGRDRKEGARIDKPIVHGDGFKGINFNLFALAPRLHPDLAVIDGYEGMQGNGPVGGTAVDHRVAVVSRDWLAADRVSVELMGIDFAKIGYLNYCANAGLGQADISQMEIIGATIKDHVKTYQLHDRVEEQLAWMSA
ncbi:MAG: DUF362 domain-containing protein [bacterium]|jgi:uncharacterized protein (DUF362 family)